MFIAGNYKLDIILHQKDIIRFYDIQYTQAISLKCCDFRNQAVQDSDKKTRSRANCDILFNLKSNKFHILSVSLSRSCDRLGFLR